MNNYWKDKKINCLGDSITHGANNNGVSWVDKLAGLMPETTIVKYGVSGSTVSDTGDQTHAFVRRFADMDMDYDCTIIFGGVNDFNHAHPIGSLNDRTPDTFIGALWLIVTGLLNRCPDGELMFITPMKSRDFKGYPHWSTRNDAGYTLADYCAAIKAVAASYSIPVLDLFTSSGITPDIEVVKERYLSDGLHPTDAGYARIARKIASFIENVL